MSDPLRVSICNNNETAFKAFLRLIAALQSALLLINLGRRFLRNKNLRHPIVNDTLADDNSFEFERKSDKKLKGGKNVFYYPSHYQHSNSACN